MLQDHVQVDEFCGRTARRYVDCTRRKDRWSVFSMENPQGSVSR
jgi:hypothetical protein